MSKMTSVRWSDADLLLLQEVSEAYHYPLTSADLLRALIRYPEKLVAHRAEQKAARSKASDLEREAERKAAEAARAERDAAKRAKQEHAAHIKTLKVARDATAARRDALEKQIGLEAYNHPSIARDQPDAYAEWTALNNRVSKLSDQIKAEKEATDD